MRPTLPEHLQRAQEQIFAHAKNFGLSPFETVFEMVDYKQMNMIASYLGFPTRYTHWRFGMEYERTAKSYEWGLHKIYELVINNDPCYAYLLEGNSTVEQKLVIAHVYGHSDFFRNNAWFAHTPRNMMDEMANHGARISRIIDRYGAEEVEDFIDTCLSVDNLIDYHAPFIRRQPQKSAAEAGPEDTERSTVHKLKAKSYMDGYVNPESFLQAQRDKMQAEAKRAERIPEHPERDVMRFLLDHAPLKRWQAEILSIVRQEAYYFAPQAQTKIMNEGWASYWHSKIMTEKVLDDAEVIEFATCHSGTMAQSPGSLNPYKLGIELFRDIEERWNKGRFGKEYEDCEDMEERAHWDRHLGLGRDKIFEVRRTCNDISFLDYYLTPDFCWRFNLFTYEYNKKNQRFEIFSRDFSLIKAKLLEQLTNLGNPIISVEDGNFRNRSELLLVHQHFGVDLRKDYAREVLSNLQKLWTRPVHLRTVVDGKRKLWTHTGDHFKEDVWSEPF